MGYLSKVDEDIAKFYAPMVLESIGYGESQVNIWFPSSGKTLITKQIIENKKIMKQVLGKMSDRLIFVPISCEMAHFEGLSSIISDIINILKIIHKKEDTYDDLLNKIINYINLEIKNKDKEFVFVINKIEEIEKKEIDRVLYALSKIVASNRIKIHTIINTYDFDILNRIVNNNSLSNLAHKHKIIPVLNGNLLSEWIKEKMIIFNKKLTDTQIKKTIDTYGGILALSKEAVRSFPDTEPVKIKAKSIFMDYDFENLKKFGVQNLLIFKENIFTSKGELIKTLKLKLKGKNKILFDFFENNKKKIVSKDDIAEIIWNNPDVSDWAINQVVSRFRKKLTKLGVDPENLETINGKGYVWR